MGFGSVIATAISIIVLMAAGYMLVGGVTHSADVTGASVKSAADLENQRLKTALADRRDRQQHARRDGSPST